MFGNGELGTKHETLEERKKKLVLGPVSKEKDSFVLLFYFLNLKTYSRISM